MKHAKLFLASLLVMGGVFLGSSIFDTQTASAARASDCHANNGRDCWLGYFDGNVQKSGDDVIPGGVYAYDSEAFISEVAGWLRCSAYPNDHNSTAGSFIVLTMLGVLAQTSSKTDACARFNEWAERIRQYSAAGRIDFNYNYSYTTNTFYQPAYNDIAYYPNAGTSPSIVFKDGGGGVLYGIRRACANPVGDLQYMPPLPPPPPNWTLRGDSSVNRGDVYPGEPIRFDHRVTNNGPDPATFYYGSRRNYNGGAPIDLGTPLANGLPAGGYVGNADDFVMPVNGANQVCGWIDYNPDRYGGGYNKSATQCAAVRQPIPQCGGVIYNPLNPEPTQEFDVTATIAYPENRALNSAVNTGGQFFIRVYQTSNPSRNLYNGTVPFTTSGSTMTATVSDIGPAAIGATYTVEYRIIGGAGAGGNCSTTKTIAYYPYFNAIGGDVAAGAGFRDSSGTCSTVSGAGISSWNNDSYPFYGAGSQLAALALGKISHFATATNVGNGTTSSFVNNAEYTNNQIDNLAFTNNNAAKGNYDGLDCMPDFFTKAMTAANAAGTTVPNLTGVNVASGTYKPTLPSAPLVISGGQLSAGRTTTMVVDGDVFIAGNITYAGATTTSQIPRFTIIAKGNIYVAPTVTELHGVYVAQKDGSTGGVVYTCATGIGAPIIDYATCINKLTFFGAVASDKIELRRTGGSLNGTNTTTTSTISGINTATWKLNGTAKMSGSVLSLTDNGVTQQSGNAISNTNMSTDNLSVKFDMQMPNANGADGIGLAFLPTNTDMNKVGLPGCGLGYYGLGGLGIMFDTYKNRNDPSDNFMGIPRDSPFDTLNCTFDGWRGSTVDLNGKVNLRAGQHTVVATITNGTNLKVSIDGVEYLSRTYSFPSEVKIALTAGNGNITNNHNIRNFTATSTTNPASTVDNAAETFQYSPELWMSTAGGATNGTTGGLKYDAITSLAPTL